MQLRSERARITLTHTRSTFQGSPPQARSVGAETGALDVIQQAFAPILVDPPDPEPVELAYRLLRELAERQARVDELLLP